MPKANKSSAILIWKERNKSIKSEWKPARYER